MSTCHVLADDLTGALDCAAAFAHEGDIPVALRRPADLPWRARVEVCATASRGVSADEMARRLSGCIDWLADARTSFKKIDSLLRGNTFAEVAWLAASGRFRQVVFAPAFPALRRRVVDGRLVVAAEGAAPPGPGVVLREELARFGGGADIWIPETADDADLDRLVSRFAAAEDVLWCGSAGLALALARSRGVPAPQPAPGMVPAADILIATASRHPVLRAQLARTVAAIEDAAAPSARVRLADFASPDELAPPQAASALAEGASRIVARSLPPQLLVAIGGDSLLALCEAAQTRALVAGPPPRAGWGSARLVGGHWNGVRCLSRSGAFGGPDDSTALLSSCGAFAPASSFSERTTTP